MGLRSAFSPVQIQKIGNDLERIEGKPDGQGGRGLREGESQLVQGLGPGPQQIHQHPAIPGGDAEDAQEEIQILEHRQHADIQHQRSNKNALLPRLRAESQPEVGIAQQYQQRQVQRLPHGIEQQTEYQQRRILSSDTRKQIIHQHRRR